MFLRKRMIRKAPGTLLLVFLVALSSFPRLFVGQCGEQRASAADVATLEPAESFEGIASQPLDQDIRDCVRLLGAQEFRTRERAENELRAMGSTAIEVLQANIAHEDLEIRVRVQRLVGELRSSFISEAVPKDLEDRFKGYGHQSFATRKTLLASLRSYTGQGRLLLLARLARIESSELLAKYAAIMLLQTDLEQHDGGLKAAQSEILEGIELSFRPPVDWARIYAQSYDGDVAKAVELCRNAIEQEQLALQRFDKSTDEIVVRELTRFLVRLMLRGDLRDEAIVQVKSMIDSADPSAREAMELLDWIDELGVSEVAEHFYKQNGDLFQDDAILLYRMSVIFESQGNVEEGQNLAKAAFESAGSGVSAHLERYDGMLPLPLRQHLLQDPGDETARRFAIAKILDDEIGQIAWAEKEYRAAIGSPLEKKDKATKHPLRMGQFQGQARISFSEMLHDQARDKEAAEQLQAVVKAFEKSPKFAISLLDRVLGGIQSRMHYFYGCDAASRKAYEEEREHLTKAIAADPEDVDVLIGMFRSTEAPDAWKKDAERRVTETIEGFEDGLRRARSTLRNANSGRSAFERQVAMLENQYAWLVGNTMGDIDAAIAASHHSLEVYRGEGGFLDTLGRCYFRKGDLESAMKYQRQAVKAAPHEGQIRRQLEMFESQATQAKQAQQAADDESSRRLDK